MIYVYYNYGNRIKEKAGYGLFAGIEIPHVPENGGGSKPQGGGIGSGCNGRIHSKSLAAEKNS